ncbi:MAG: hypothetical protein SFW36_17765 [Leptolyngbyaceae cyanobacterium bins.59]|nr:hypothetical protein [Leptolyngbyaceae cyanobacterium bins.59]
MNDRYPNPNFLRWLVAGLLSALLLPSASFLPGIQAVAQPTELPSSCYPRIPATQPVDVRLARIGATTYQGTEYRLYHVDTPGRQFLYVAAIKGKQCKSAYSNPMGDENLYFHKTLPLPVARQMALSQVDFAIREAGGIQVFRTRFNQLPQGFSLAEEEVWALGQRGIQLPAGIRVVKANQ